ncbi:hypothetical protein J2W54_004575 [Rhodococcus fascians]|jgi:hypothetical protein|uniref:Uncharacterized protein n=2 Tax=root TaxID=1 RepID=A0A143QFW7_RHOFA|nr:hypothetical protein A3Q41_00642 [Rhodococcus fascians]AMY54057.1 hypothetical protein A3L23_02720 [Rhodococcus fascians D188]KJV04462.1 hypothetical protein VF34_00119 [Rhodococcus sp. PML026]MDP9638564.1 hypothetical protein [Rhodococcus cercidiphylli]MDR6912264.1 hypothetical protein [Rhodococcus sp. 3258]
MEFLSLLLQLLAVGSSEGTGSVVNIPGTLPS